MTDYVYILRCSDDSLYTGYTNDLKRRLKMHNEKKASKYTRSRTPVEYVFTHACVDKSQALSLEYRIKQLSRKDKIKLIRGEKRVDDLF